jgi:predicted RNA polymerase sigma factor
MATMRGALLARLYRSEEARRDFDRAAGLTRNALDLDLFPRRAAQLSTGS